MHEMFYNGCVWLKCLLQKSTAKSIIDKRRKENYWINWLTGDQSISVKIGLRSEDKNSLSFWRLLNYRWQIKQWILRVKKT